MTEPDHEHVGRLLTLKGALHRARARIAYWANHAPPDSRESGGLVLDLAAIDAALEDEGAGRWSSIPPTEPGWYWLRTASQPPAPVNVWRADYPHRGFEPGLMVNDCEFDPPIVQPPEFVRGEWWSLPIQEPPA